MGPGWSQSILCPVVPPWVQRGHQERSRQGQRTSCTEHAERVVSVKHEQVEGRVAGVTLIKYLSLGSLQNGLGRASLAVQWLSLHLSIQRVWVLSLFGEQRSHMPHSQKTKTCHRSNIVTNWIKTFKKWPTSNKNLEENKMFLLLICLHWNDGSHFTDLLGFSQFWWRNSYGFTFLLIYQLPIVA